MSQRVIRDRRSHAQRALDPFELMALANDNNVEDAWDIFSERLKDAGFARCAFGYGRRSGETPLSDPSTRVFGQIVSDKYQEAARALPSLQLNSRPYKLIRNTPKPVTFFGEQDLKGASPSEMEISRYAINEFDLKGWALMPVHAPEKDRLFLLGWWNLESNKEATRLWETEGKTFSLAASYFCETISKVIDKSSENPAPSLSPREMECLLWAGAGRTTAEIADILGVADGTVEEYFNRAAKKLGASTRAQACVKAVLHGFIRP